MNGKFWEGFDKLFESMDSLFEGFVDSLEEITHSTDPTPEADASGRSVVKLSVKDGGRIDGVKVNGWKIEAHARKGEELTIEAEGDKLTERRVRTDPDGRRVETIRVIERPQRGPHQEKAKAQDGHKGGR